MLGVVSFSFVSGFALRDCGVSVDVISGLVSDYVVSVYVYVAGQGNLWCDA